MATTIKKLTEEQKSWIPGVVSHWINYSLNFPEKADTGMYLWQKPDPIRDLQENMDWLYTAASLPTPRCIEVDSPYSMQLVANFVQKLPWDSFRGEEADIECALRIAPAMAADLAPNTVLRRADIVKSLKKHLGVESLNTETQKAMDNLTMSYVPTACIGIGHDAGWAAYYSYYKMVGGDTISNNEHRLKIVEDGIWDCIVLYDIAIACRRPYKVRLDDQQRLHSLESPALEWADGHRLYFVSGVHMPAKYFTDPSTLTSKEVFDQSNVEVRKGLIQIMGVEKFIASAGGTVIDEDVDSSGMPRRLIRMNTKTSNGDNFTVVEVECPSKHDKHYLFVPPNMLTCAKAIAWTFDVEDEYYAPLIET